MRQMKFILGHVLAKHTCYFCHKPVLEGFEWVSPESLTIHHLDFNHYNDAPENTAVAHSTCHRSFHMTETRARMLEGK